MERYTRTDLACESCNYGEGLSEHDEYTEDEEDGFGILRISVNEEKTANELGKPKGKYITVYSGRIWSMEQESADKLSMLIAKEVRKLCEHASAKPIDKSFCVLIVGLGNIDITPDAVGPIAVRSVQATRHIKSELPEYFDAFGKSQIALFAPGVLGQTGIETLELVRGAAQNVKPDAVVAIDALVARSCERLSTTVQITDTGINPGSGIGNNRRGITKDTLGVPVISIGIPTVVDSSTLVYDALRRAKIEKISDELIEVLESGRGFFVSPKESDIITKKLAEIIADALELAFSCD